MVFALTDTRPDELPGILAHLLSVAPPVDAAKYLAPCGRVQMRVDGVLHLVPLPAR